MKQGKKINHQFVEYIPEQLENGVLYVSIPYHIAVHKCMCGCGRQVDTPLSPTDWEVSFNGESVTLNPSIGSWSIPCQSHYWIRRDTVVWAARWTKTQIEEGRRRDRMAKESSGQIASREIETPSRPARKGLLSAISEIVRAWFR